MSVATYLCESPTGREQPECHLLRKERVMTKAFVGARAVVVAFALLHCVPVSHEHRKPNAELGPTIKHLRRVKDEVSYWALQIYLHILKAIADVSGQISNHPRKIAR